MGQSLYLRFDIGETQVRNAIAFRPSASPRFSPREHIVYEHTPIDAGLSLPAKIRPERGNGVTKYHVSPARLRKAYNPSLAKFTLTIESVKIQYGITKWRPDPLRTYA